MSVADPRGIPTPSRNLWRLPPRTVLVLTAGLPAGRVTRVSAPLKVLVYSDDGEGELVRITQRGLHPLTSLVRRSSLEDVFLRLTGRSLIE